MKFTLHKPNARLGLTYVSLDKTQIRFSARALERFGIEVGQEWVIATNSEDEKDKSLYLINPKFVKEKNIGTFKVKKYGSSSTFINARSVLSRRNDVPTKCDIEIYVTDDNVKTLKITPHKNKK